MSAVPARRMHPAWPVAVVTLAALFAAELLLTAALCAVAAGLVMSMRRPAAPVA